MPMLIDERYPSVACHDDCGERFQVIDVVGEELDYDEAATLRAYYAHAATCEHVPHDEDSPDYEALAKEPEEEVAE